MNHKLSLITERILAIGPEDTQGNPTSKSIRLAASVFCLAFLSSCSLIPDLRKPENTIPENFPQQLINGEAIPNDTAEQLILSQVAWQNYYRDEVLKELIKTGLENNKDLKTAALRISEARAQYGVEKSNLFPDLTADGDFTRQKTNGAGFSGGAGANEAASGGNSTIFDRYTVSAGLTAFEIDFFGRIRSMKDSALNKFLATKAAWQTVRISLIADIANAYTSLRANQALLSLAEETVQSRQESFNLIKRRTEAGISTDLELAQAETLLMQARVDLYDFINAINQDKNALRLLLGTPASLPELKPQETDNDISNIMTGLPVGLPSTLLTSRPDIIEAECRLYSANADIGAARAAFFPRISLTTTGGYSSDELSGLFDSASQIWTFTPRISVPFFTSGRLSNNLDLAEIRKEVAIVEYESAIENAFREVSDAISAVSTSDDRLKAQNDLVDAASRRSMLSERRYKAGIENYLAVLDAKRELYEAQQNEIRIRRQNFSHLITLYKTLGGGAEKFSGDNMQNQ